MMPSPSTEIRGLVLCVLIALFGHIRPCEAQWIVSAYAGGVHTLSAELAIDQLAQGTQVTFADAAFRSSSFEFPIYYGWRVGHSLHGMRHVFVEGEFIHPKVFLETNRPTSGSGRVAGSMVNGIPVGSVVQRFSISHGLNFILVNAVIRQPVARGRLALTLRGGAGPTVPHGETEIGGRAQEGYEWGGLGIQAAAGSEARVSRHLYLLGEYKFTRAHPKISIDDGFATLSARSHHLAFGLTAVF